MTVTDESLMRDLLNEHDNVPIILVLNEVLGGPIDNPNFATWRAVDADAIRRLGLWEGVHDSGLAADLHTDQWEQLAALLEPLGVDVTGQTCPHLYECGPGCRDAIHTGRQ